jgi:retron-type reverse transcriptase
MGKPGKRRNRRQRLFTRCSNEDITLNRYDVSTFPRAKGRSGPSRFQPCGTGRCKPCTGLSLDPVAQTTADPNSYGFRRGRWAADAIEACFIALCKSDRAQWILEGDIKSCFDHISHKWILAHIPMDKAILKKWLKARYMENRRLYPTKEGTPQGGICSPVIANMVLDGLEQILASHFSKTSRKGRRAKVNLICGRFLHNRKLERTPGARSQTSCGAIPQRTRITTLNRENRDHAYRTRL